MLPSPSRPLLVVAHPGHELRVRHWMGLARPRVVLFTDGSGGAASDRRHGSAALLQATGAEAGMPFGFASDRAFYAALLRGDETFFEGLLALIEAEVAGRELVVSDAPEGYNPVHDLCHALTALAVARVREGGQSVRHLCFPLEGPPGAGGPGGLAFDLDAEALQAKLAAAAAYPGLREECETALARHGAEAFAREVLSPAPGPLETGFRGQPSFEAYGERMVAAGRYREVLRWATHLRPLLERLAEAAVAA